jgi:hypothetical protein
MGPTFETYQKRKYLITISKTLNICLVAKLPCVVLTAAVAISNDICDIIGRDPTAALSLFLQSVSCLFVDNDLWMNLIYTLCQQVKKLSGD